MTNTAAKLEIFYRPVINPSNDQIMIYRAVPVVTKGDEVQTGAKQVLKYSGDPIEVAHKNIAVIRKAAFDLELAHEAGNAVFLIMPISAKALENKESASLMVKALKSLPAVCSKAAISHVFDLPERISLDTLDDIVIPLLITIDKFLIEPPATMSDYTDISGCNAQGVVLDMQPGEGSELKLSKFWAVAAPRRLGIFVQNISDQDSIDSIKYYEGRGMDGPIFGSLLDAIGPRSMFSGS